jgi:4-hydroxybenzoate polyprenyltransferase
MLIAFLTGGIALITRTHWLLWTCAAIFVLGIPAGKAIGIMDDTVEWGSSEAAHYGTETEASERASKPKSR